MFSDPPLPNPEEDTQACDAEAPTQTRWDLLKQDHPLLVAFTVGWSTIAAGFGLVVLVYFSGLAHFLLLGLVVVGLFGLISFFALGLGISITGVKLNRPGGKDHAQ